MATDNTAGAGLVAPGAGVIHDIGYQTYDGQRFGRGQIALALCWHSLRSAFGFGRGAKAKILPVITFVIMCSPAVINAVVMALGRSHTRVVDYDTYAGNLRVLVLLVFMAAQAPELVSRDLRSRVLPLYFARPIRRQDYPLAKYAAFTLACLAMIDIPVLLLYVGTILQVHGGAAVWAQTRAAGPWPAGRADVGSGPGRSRARARLRERPQGLLDRLGRDFLLPDLHARERADPDRGHVWPARGRRPCRRRRGGVG